MFTKTDDAKRPHHAAPPGAARARPTRWGNSSVIVSNRMSGDEEPTDDGLVIEGNLECTVVHHRNHLTVAKNARVKGDIQSNKVIVLGTVVGNIYSEGMVSLIKGCEVTGDISCASLYIDEDAKFMGEINMQDLPNVVIMPADAMQAEAVHARTLPAERVPPAPDLPNPVQSKPVHPEPIQAKSVTTQAVESTPAKTETVRPDPARTSPVAANPEAAESVQAEPVRARTVEANPLEAESVPDMPMEEKSPRSGKGQPHVAKPGIYA